MTSSFPSFASFPEPEEDAPTRSKDKKERSNREKERNKVRERRRERKRSRSRSRSGSREQSPKRDRGGERREKKRHREQDNERRSRLRPEVLEPEDDERDKARQDRALAEGREPESRPGTHPWFSDFKGDPLNETYGKLYKGAVPKFRRAERRRVLGLPPGYQVQGSWHTDGGVDIGRRGQVKIPRYSDPKFLAVFAETAAKRLHPPSTPQPLADPDFVKVTSSRRQAEDDPFTSYRAITASEARPYDSDSEHTDSVHGLTSEDEDGPGGGRRIHLTAQQEAIKELEITLTRDPTLIDSWLYLVRLSIAESPITAKRGPIARAEISLGVLKRALDAHPQNRTSVLLRVSYLEAGEEIWHRGEQAHEWEVALKALGGPGIDLGNREIIWGAWLSWAMRDAKNADDFLPCFRRALVAFTFAEGETIRVRLLWRLCVHLHESGYSERAMGVFQAQMELTLFCPETLSSASHQEKVAELEEFWESEVPRFAEANATGWASWAINRTKSEQPPQTSEKIDPVIDNDLYTGWMREENLREPSGRFSTRSWNESEEDPYSTVMFFDLQDYLTEVITDRGKELLRLAFLAFLGVPIPGIDNHPSLSPLSTPYKPPSERVADLQLWSLSTTPGWPSNPLSLFPSPDVSRAVTWESIAGITVGAEHAVASGFGPIHHWGYGTRGWLDGIGRTCEQRMWEGRTDGPIVDAIRCSLEQLRATMADEATRVEWDSMRVAWEASISTKSALKLSKKLLETQRNSVELWAFHARLERLRSKFDEAQKVYTMALQFPTSDRDALLYDAAEFAWLRGNNTSAIQVIAHRLGVEGSVEGVGLLRVKRALHSQLDLQQVGSLRWGVWVKTRCLLELLTTSVDPVEHCLALFDALVGDVPPPSHPHETMTVASCVMLYHHSVTLKATMQPAILRNRVQESLEWYPENTILLALFLESEKGQGVWGRVRSLLDEDIQGRSISRIVWEVWAEGWESGRWEPERVRTKLEKAASSERLRTSPLLWKVYITFEIRVGDLRRAKGLFYRSLVFCPWVKSIYLTAFGPLRRMFSRAELDELFATMVERRIRIRRDIEDYLDGWVGADAMDVDGENDVGDREVEAAVTEQQRLKPF